MMKDFTVLVIFFLELFMKFAKSTNITMINAEESSLRCGPNQIIVFGDYDRIRKYALLRCAEILLCGQISVSERKTR